MESDHESFLGCKCYHGIFGACRQYKDVAVIFQASEQGLLKACTSTMVIDSVTYLLGVHLKQQGIHEPEKRHKVRGFLNALLSYIDVVDLLKNQLASALNDQNFKDIEDSYQYYCALESGCDILITINTKDFPEEEEGIEVFSPQDFATKCID